MLTINEINKLRNINKEQYSLLVNYKHFIYLNFLHEDIKFLEIEEPDGNLKYDQKTAEILRKRNLNNDFKLWLSNEILAIIFDKNIKRNYKTETEKSKNWKIAQLIKFRSKRYNKFLKGNEILLTDSKNADGSFLNVEENPVFSTKTEVLQNLEKEDFLTLDEALEKNKDNFINKKISRSTYFANNKKIKEIYNLITNKGGVNNG